MTQRDEMIAALQLADDVLRVVLKVYGHSPLIAMTREKIAAALRVDGELKQEETIDD